MTNKKNDKDNILKLDLTSLKKTGAIVDQKPVKKIIDVNIDGQDLRFDVYIKKQSFGTFSKFLENREDFAKNDKSYIAEMIAKSVVKDETGKDLIFTHDQALSLHQNFASALIQAINEVNGNAKKK